MVVKKTNNYYETYMWVLQMVVENQQLLRYLYLNIVMVVKKLTFIMRPICGYCNGCKKNQQLLRDLYVGIANGCRKPTTITLPIFEYCNGCKKINIYYETYMRVLQWL